MNDVLNILGDINGKTVVDCTFGAGGYSRAFLERGANVIAFDRDPSVLPTAQKLEQEFGERFEFINEPFSEIRTLLCRLNNSPLGGSRRDKVEPVGGQDNNSPHRIAAGGGSATPPKGGSYYHAIVFDFGVSSMQIDTAERGFSWRFDSALDMRMGVGANNHLPLQTATELIRNSSVDNLAKILREYGDVKKADVIARAIKEKSPQTTFELRDLIYNPKDIAPVFQALRIAVNDELGEIKTALAAVPALLAPGGVCACVTFHSLEDRLVKNIFREWTTAPGDPRIPAPMGVRGTPLQLLKTIKPTDAEIAANPRARSAHLRAVRALHAEHRA